MHIGRYFNVECTPLKIVGVALKYVTNTNIKYLGIYLDAGTHFKCSVDHVNVKFYLLFNCIFCRSKTAQSEIVSVELLKSFLFTVITLWF